ncbi:MAG: LLM class F420-dependent oxidoreductase [Steroidobacteraceae bacterium]
MKIGAVYPQIELGGDPEAFDRIARSVEPIGFDHLLMYDHVVGAVHENREPPLWQRGPYTDKHPFHDPLVALAYVAGITRRIELVTGVLILPQRQTVLVAKQATDLDLLSGGRLRLGVGSGWNYVEYDALGQNFATRGERLTEQIEYLRRLWSEPLVTFHGKFDSIDRANIIPRPKRPIPIYCGGFAEPMFKRAARMADGFIFASGIDFSLHAWSRLQQLLAEAGRPVAGFGAECILQDDRSNGMSRQEALDAARRWQDVGGTHVSVVTMGRGYRTPEEHIHHLAEAHVRLQAALNT